MEQEGSRARTAALVYYGQDNAKRFTRAKSVPVPVTVNELLV